MTTPPVSAFLICQDEEACIEPAIRSLAGFDEIVVVDSGSTDGTRAILDRLAAEGFPIRFVHNPWPGYARQKQVALELCRNDWCFSLDADERLDEAFRAVLPALLADPGTMGWKLPRVESLYGYGYVPKGVRSKPILRLCRKSRSRFDLSALVHEGLVVDGPVKTVPSGAMLHARPLPIAEQLVKEAKYGSLKARQRRRDGKRASLFKLVFNPLFYFLRIYFRDRHFLCGRAGFIHAMTGLVYSFAAEASHAEAEMHERRGAGAE